MISLPPGWKIEFAHRHCPRCGLDLTGQISRDDELAIIEFIHLTEMKNREASGHQHFVPMIQRQFFEWMAHARKFITGK